MAFKHHSLQIYASWKHFAAAVLLGGVLSTLEHAATVPERTRGTCVGEDGACPPGYTCSDGHCNPAPCSNGSCIIERMSCTDGNCEPDATIDFDRIVAYCVLALSLVGLVAVQAATKQNKNSEVWGTGNWEARRAL